jgi:transcriptional regulator with XRE-family HTH domain
MTAFLAPSILTQEKAVEIRVMARRGEGVRAIARQLGCSRNTVRRYLREQQVARYGPRAARACKLDDYKDPALLWFEQVSGPDEPVKNFRGVPVEEDDGGLKELDGVMGFSKRARRR